MATEPMMHQPTCDFVRCNSSRTTFIKGAMPNQAKKQRKKANHVMWNARIGGVEKVNRLMRAALLFAPIGSSPSECIVGAGNRPEGEETGGSSLSDGKTI